MRASEAEFSPNIQNVAIASLDQWDSLHIASGTSRADFSLTYRISFEEAIEFGGLELNNIGKSYYLLKKLGIDQKERKELLLKINRDLSKYEELYNLIQSMTRDETEHANNATPAEMAKPFPAWADDE